MLQVEIINKSKHELPKYSTIQSAGLDIKANIDAPITLNPLERKLIPTGLYIALPDGFEAQIRPRSGMALKHGITVLNTPGTVDADYRGEIGVILINFAADCPRLYVRVSQQLERFYLSIVTYPSHWYQLRLRVD